MHWIHGAARHAAAFQWICDLKDVLGCCFCCRVLEVYSTRRSILEDLSFVFFVAVCRSRLGWNVTKHVLQGTFSAGCLLCFRASFPSFWTFCCGSGGSQMIQLSWCLGHYHDCLDSVLIQIDSVDSNFMSWDFTFCGSDCFKESTLEELR